MFHLYKYKTPAKYLADFKKTYSYTNIGQVKTVSGIYLALSVGARIASCFYINELSRLPNYMEYNINNWGSIIGSFIFLVLSKKALKSDYWKPASRNLLTVLFCLFILSVTFAVSYIFSLHNPKNTLTIFLIGIIMVSLFFALDFKQIIVTSLFVFLLFTTTMVIPHLTAHERLFNIMAAAILVFFLYSCSRYSYYFKSEHFVQVKQLEEKNEEVQNLNHQKGEILGFVAHDIRNPLNNIEALTRIILEENKDKQNPEMQLILSSIRHAKNIINDLIEVVQGVKISFQVQNTNMILFINGICTAWQTNINKERAIHFKTKETDLIAAINISKLTRVIDNLIGNGLKFSSPGTPIDIEVSKAGNTCLIKITDFGIGIPEHLQELLFDQFSRAGRPGLKGEKSIGLGLHISKQIIEQHGGTLNVKSKENEGTTFQITIPLAIS